jgi:protoporphyrin/coproporphyrin ferrochelatase
MKHRLGIVLMNLGGPDSLSAVRPFLQNLFSDPAIISYPWPIRSLLARLISRSRTAKAKEIYKKMGGKSPILENTQQQQELLCRLLRENNPDQDIEVFIAMRYWHPLTFEAVNLVKAFRPDELVLLPLYPQYSQTTTGSSFAEWHRQAHRQGLIVPTREICCYPQEELFIKAHVDLLLPHIKQASLYGKPRILFSAHGLPQKVIDAGDPYEIQVQQTAQGILEKIPVSIDYRVCYQSKIGPLKWLEPSLREELKNAAGDQVPVVIVPIAFVSEHSETLVELDLDYKEFAAEQKVPFYSRVPALGAHPLFGQALVELITQKKPAPPCRVVCQKGELCCR